MVEPGAPTPTKKPTPGDNKGDFTFLTFFSRRSCIYLSYTRQTHSAAAAAAGGGRELTLRDGKVRPARALTSNRRPDVRYHPSPTFYFFPPSRAEPWRSHPHFHRAVISHPSVSSLSRSRFERLSLFLFLFLFFSFPAASALSLLTFVSPFRSHRFVIFISTLFYFLFFIIISFWEEFRAVSYFSLFCFLFFPSFLLPPPRCLLRFSSLLGRHSRFRRSLFFCFFVIFCIRFVVYFPRSFLQHLTNPPSPNGRNDLHVVNFVRVYVFPFRSGKARERERERKRKKEGADGMDTCTY